MSRADDILNSEFGTLPALVAAYAAERPGHPAVIDPDGMLTYGQLDARADRVAAALQRDGAKHSVSIVSYSRNDYVTVYVGALRAGLAVAPLAPSSLPEQIVAPDRDRLHGRSQRAARGKGRAGFGCQRGNAEAAVGPAAMPEMRPARPDQIRGLRHLHLLRL